MSDGFEIDGIDDEAIRERYRRIERRGRRVAAALAESFPDKPPIQFAYVREPHFNAYACRAGDAYRIEITSPLPLMIVLLFDKLLADARLLPWLEQAPSGTIDYTVAFAADPLDFGRRQDWSIGLSSLRSFAAGILADIALTFVLLHEAGHIICGHADASAADGRVSELFLWKSDAPTQGRGLAWESDADAVAATLLLDYVAEILHVHTADDRARIVFGHEHPVEHVLSLVIVGLFALFSYVRGARYALGQVSSHPHPIVRAYYVKDMLLAAARNRWPLDLRILANLIDDRLDEMLQALETLGLSDNASFTDEYIEQIDEQLAMIADCQRRFRPTCSAWFEWMPTVSSAV